MATYNLGNALTALGERERDIERLHGAILAYREAIENCGQETGTHIRRMGTSLKFAEDSLRNLLKTKPK
jgi:hypothetical protein